MSLKALQTIETHKQREAETSLKRWRELMNRLIKQDDLNDAEALELDTLHTQLAIVPTLAEYAAKALEQISKRDAHKHHKRAEAAHHDAEQAIVEHERAGEALAARHRQESQAHYDQTQDLFNAKLSARVRLDQAEATSSQLTTLEKELWQLLEARDPAEVAAEQAEHDAREAKRRHVSHCWKGISDRYRDAKYPIVHLETLVTNANASWGNLADCEFIPLPDQTPEEMAALVTIARSVNTGGGPWRYLVEDPNCQFIQSLQYSTISAWFEFAEVTKQGGRFDPGMYRWMTHPGQTQERLDKLVAKLQRAYDTRFEPSMPHDWIEDQQANARIVRGDRGNVIRATV